MNKSPDLVINYLTKEYSSYNLRVEDLSINKGEFVSILGPSGSGKSTFIRCISGLTEASSLNIEFGGIRYDDKDIGDIRNQIAFIFQDYNLIPRVSAITNVLLGNLGRKRGVSGFIPFFTHEERTEAMRILDSVHMLRHAYKDVGNLSGGQKQRVAIARALAQKPKLILADEPIASLDPESSQLIMDLFKQINKDSGVTLITNLHQPDYAENYSDRIIRLNNGRIVKTIDYKDGRSAANW